MRPPRHAFPAPRPDDPHQVPWWAQGSHQPRLEPHQVRLRTLPAFTGAVAVTVAVLTGLAGILVGVSQPRIQPVADGGIAIRQTTDGLLGGCGPVFEFPAHRKISGIVPSERPGGTAPYRPAYATTVPVFGPFWAHPAPTTHPFWSVTDRWQPQPENLLYNMWQGWMVVYYTRTARQSEVQALNRLTQHHPQIHLLVAPWPTYLGALPANRTIAFAVWGASQTCQRLDIPALEQFRATHPPTAAPGGHGAPPPTIRATWTVGTAHRPAPTPPHP